MDAVVFDQSLEQATARFFKVLSDPTRLKILQVLSDRPHSVKELVEAVGSSQARISTHLACLRWCEFVETRRDGRQIVYSVKYDEIKFLISRGKSIASNAKSILQVVRE